MQEAKKPAPEPAAAQPFYRETFDKGPAAQSSHKSSKAEVIQEKEDTPSPVIEDEQPRGLAASMG